MTGRRDAEPSRRVAFQAFTAEAAAVVSTWAATPDEVVSWCSRTEAPVPPDVIAGWSGQPGVRAYLLLDAGRPVAYGELWIDDEEEEVELARLVVDPERRGQHLGRALARRLTREARRAYPTVFLRLVPGNAAALRCYSGAGFARVDPVTERAWNENQPTPYVWMTYVGARGDAGHADRESRGGDEGT